MDNFAVLPSDERRLYFQQAAARLGLSAQIVEKDFWVCWCLRRLFSLAEFRDHLTFKGGTTLSKVYHVIERFSEDVDIAIERSFLGFGGDMEPEAATSGKEQRRRIEGIKTACQNIINERLMPQLKEIIARHLPTDTNWKLFRDTTDKDNQTLLFEYPPVIADALSHYFPASVKIEIGARSDHFPVENATVKPYLADTFPTTSLPDNIVQVRVLAAERTFWEKVTILHSLHHFPPGKTIPPRMSRHYYDVFQLAKSDVLKKALAANHLLDRVATHKSIFFKAKWANYDKAHIGTIRLTPNKHIINTLRQDYLAMQPMFFSHPPAFDEILCSLPELENIINNAGQ